MHKTIFSRFLWVGGARIFTVGLGVARCNACVCRRRALLAPPRARGASSADRGRPPSSPFLALRIILGSVFCGDRG